MRFSMSALVLSVAAVTGAVRLNHHQGPAPSTARDGRDPPGTRLADTLPLQPPQLRILQRSSQDAPGLIFVAPKSAASGLPHGPEILDDQGRPVWFHPIAEDEQASDFRVQRYRGNPVLTWWQGSLAGGHGEGVDYVVDSSYALVATVRAGNGLDADAHEFTLTPEGTALITIFHQVPYNLSSLGGPSNGSVLDGVVQEIELKTGHVLFEWHSLGHVPLDESHVPVPTSAATSYDYFHVNAASLDEHGDLLIDARNTWTVYNVDRHTGRINWRLGGKRTDFELGAGVEFAWQHDPRAVGNGTIRIFDDEASPPVRPYSRVIWVHLDQPDGKASLVRTVQHPAGLLATAQGNAQALNNGDTFVGWGSLGRVSEFDDKGSLLFDASFPPGIPISRAYRSDWIGHPGAAPTATARHNFDGTTTVHVVWNGATQVADWRVLAGPTVNALTAVATVAWNGLDTLLTIAGTPGAVVVVALDAHGHVLATSASVSSF